ncbi:MAG: histidine phosphatase family protein [Bacilli bacterium]
MKRIYLIRHSAPFVEIDNYSDYKNVSWDDYNRNMILSSLGEENAKRICDIEELNNIDSIYSSNSYRSIATAKYLAEKNNIKIKLDSRIDERCLGCDKISELPDNFSIDSILDKNLKYKSGESLNEVDERFKSFLDEIIYNDEDKIVLVIHGMILMSYLKTICKVEYKDNIFNVSFKNKEVINRKLNNPDIFKLEFENNKVINVSNIEVKLR